MNFGLTAEQKQLREEVRSFMKKEVTPEVMAESMSGMGLGPHSWEFIRKVGKRGWLAPTWPREYGGLEGSNMDKWLIMEEMAYHRAPFELSGAFIIGPAILLFGNEEQKKEWLPQIARGEIDLALGYTEPQAGSDLASIEIRAVEDGDDYVLNGQKIFNTACHYAQYHWLAARTDPEAPKHRGLSLFIVDLKSPGIDIRPLWVLDGRRVNEVFYDNVRVPKRNLVGQKNQGFFHMSTALDYERMYPTGEIQYWLDQLVEYAKQEGHSTRISAKAPLLRSKLAELAVELEVARLLSQRVVWMADQGTVPNYESSMLKMFATELWKRLTNIGMQLLGLQGQIRKGSRWAPFDGDIEIRYRGAMITTVFAGTSEIMRNIIALRGLGLPRG